MRRTTLWIVMMMVVATCLASAAVADPDLVRLTRQVLPVFQAIELDLDAEKDDYTGTVRIDLDVREATSTFRFHAVEMNLTAIVLATAEGETIGVEHETGEKGTLTVTTARELTPGRYVLTVSFSNDFNRKAGSLYKVEHAGAGYLFTQFEAEYAREAFPCWDDPGFKFPYQMTLTVPAGHTAVANTPVEKRTEVDGRAIYVFAKTRPMPSYLLAIATGPLEAVDITGLSVPGKIYTVQGQSHLAADAVEITPPILAALEKYFDRAYPYKKLDIVAIPEFLFGAMENVGHITFRDNLLLMDPKTRSIGQRRRMTMIMAHEIGHMWFGNLVTPVWWDDLWLNEAFATWIAYKITDEVYPEFKFTIADVKEKQGAMKTDALPSARPIRMPFLASGDPMELADELTYDKGQAVLSMTEAWLGEDVFRKGVILHMKTYEWKNATSDDLWLSVATAAGQDVEASIRSFIDQPGVPLVDVKTLSGSRVEVSQQRFANYGAEIPEPSIWGIPVVLRYSDGDQEYTQRVLLSEETQSVELMSAKPPVWIHPNGDERGYYRWRVPARMLEHLARTDVDMLTVRERVGLVDNLGALLDAGELRGDEYLETVRLMNEDAEPEVLKAVAEAVQRVYQDFVDEDTTDPFMFYVQKTLRPTLDHVGMVARAGEDESIPSLRSNLMLWLGYANDTEVRDALIAIARAYEENPGSVDAALVGSALQIAAANGDAALFERYTKNFETSEQPQERTDYLWALGSFKDRNIVDRALAYSLSDAVPPHEVWRIPFKTSRDKKFTRYVFEWMMGNFDAMAAKMPPMYVAFAVPGFVDGTDPGLVAEAAEFMSTPERQSPMFDKQMQKVSERVSRRVRVREKEGARVNAYLRELSLNP